MNDILSNKERLFFFSGTIGDAYIAFCKLVEYAKIEPCSIQRICRISGSDHIIQDICNAFPNLNYIQPYLHFETIPEMREFAEAHKNKYINIFYDGNGRGNEPNDPSFLTFTPFPKVNLPLISKTKSKYLIGIQLNSGSREGNRKLLNIQWVVDVCNLLSYKEIEILILGTTESFEKDQLEILESISSNVICHYDHSILEWMGYIASLDFLITPEGFPAFWGLSQKVPSIVFYHEVEAILRMHVEWRKIVIAIKLSNINGTFYPIDPTHVASIILAKLLPDHA